MLMKSALGFPPECQHCFTSKNLCTYSKNLTSGGNSKTSRYGTAAAWRITQGIYDTLIIDGHDNDAVDFHCSNKL